MMNHPAFRAGLRPDRAVLQVKGEDARHFLHNLVTADIEGLQSGQSRYAALLTPQGKIRFDMFICDAGDRFLIDCAVAKSAELLKLLGFYKLRAKVTVEPIDLKVVASPEEPESVLRFADPRYAAMGWRALVPAASASSMAEAEGYDAARIANGLADSMADLASGDIFPHEANLDQLGGVSFSKGCYVGQEVVSRMEHRGTARSRILPVRFESGSAPGTGEIRANDKVVGQLLSSADGRALALIRLDRLAEVQGPLLTETGSIMVEKPAWVRYDVPGVST